MRRSTVPSAGGRDSDRRVRASSPPSTVEGRRWQRDVYVPETLKRDHHGPAWVVPSESRSLGCTGEATTGLPASSQCPPPAATGRPFESAAGVGPSHGAHRAPSPGLFTEPLLRDGLASPWPRPGKEDRAIPFVVRLAGRATSGPDESTVDADVSQTSASATGSGRGSRPPCRRRDFRLWCPHRWALRITGCGCTRRGSTATKRSGGGGM